MKRNDILKNITDVLFYGSLAARVDNRNEMITMLAEKDAKDILELMEKLGMQPPLVPENTVETKVIVAMPMGWQELRTENSTVFVSKWEVEDET